MTIEKMNRTGKWLLSTVGAGIIGSMLTLGIVTNTDIIPTNAQKVDAPLVKDSAYNAEQLSFNEDLTLSDMVEKSSGAIVGIVNYQSTGNRFTGNDQSAASGEGSGVIYKIQGDDAYIVTNNHVIENAKKIDVSFEGGETTTAELVGKDALSDLAVLKIDAKHVKTTLKFGDSDILRAGDPVVAIGNPLGLDFSGTVTQGIVSAIDRSINVKTSAGEWALNVIQTDAAINPGNSGGALLNAAGEVIGINSLKISESGVEGLGFAIPSNEAVPLIEEMTTHGYIERAYLGVGLEELSHVPPQYVQFLPDTVEGGVIITNVDPDSPAGKANLQVEDIITAINGTKVKSASELRKFLYTELKAGDKATFTIYRGKDERKIPLTLTSNKPAQNKE